MFIFERDFVFGYIVLCAMVFLLKVVVLSLRVHPLLQLFLLLTLRLYIFNSYSGLFPRIFTKLTFFIRLFVYKHWQKLEFGSLACLIICSYLHVFNWRSFAQFFLSFKCFVIFYFWTNIWIFSYLLLRMMTMMMLISSVKRPKKKRRLLKNE